MKIAIIGYSGSGKSTLAKRLGALYGIPVLYIDRIQWLPGWKERDMHSKQEAMSSFLDGQEQWVIDGYYPSLSYERRMAEADRIIFLSLPRLVCLMRVCKRRIQNGNRARESMTPGCEERLDGEFLRWVLLDGRTKARREKMMDVLRQYPHKAVMLRSQREIDAWLAQAQRGVREGL